MPTRFRTGAMFRSVPLRRPGSEPSSTNQTSEPGHGASNHLPGRSRNVLGIEPRTIIASTRGSSAVVVAVRASEHHHDGDDKRRCSVFHSRSRGLIGFTDALERGLAFILPRELEHATWGPFRLQVMQRSEVTCGGTPSLLPSLPSASPCSSSWLPRSCSGSMVASEGAEGSHESWPLPVIQTAGRAGWKWWGDLTPTRVRTSSHAPSTWGART